MNIIWTILSCCIILFFMLNLKKGYYYVLPFIILAPPASRFLYYLSGSADYNALTLSISVINIIYFIFSAKLVYKNWTKLLFIDKTIFAYISYSFVMMGLGMISGDMKVALFAFLNTVIPMHFYFVPRFIKMNRKKFFSVLLVSLAGFLLWETYQAAYGFFPWEYEYSSMRGELVTETLEKNPFSYNASYPASMVFSILLVYQMLKESSIIKHRYLFMVIITIFFLVVLERTPLAAMIIAPLTVLVLWGSNKRKLSTRIMAIIIIVTFSQLFTLYLVPKLDTINKRQRRLSELANLQNSSNLQARINRWNKANVYFASPRIIIGYGLGFYAGDRSYASHRGLHNEFYNQTIEYGLIGLVLLLLIYYRTLKFMNEHNKNMVLPFFAGLLAFWIIALANSPFLNDSKYYHWLFIGMTVSIGITTSAPMLTSGKNEKN